MKFFLRITILWCFILTGHVSFSQYLTPDIITSGQTEFTLANDNFASSKRARVDIDRSTWKKVFVWEELDAGSTTNKNIRCKVYSESMTLIADFLVNKTTAGDQNSPVIKINQNDNSFVVAWSGWTNNTDPNDANKYDIYAKKIRFSDITTDAAGNDLLINTDDVSGRQVAPLLALDSPANDAIIAWINQDGKDNGTPTVLDFGSYARIVKMNGSALSLAPIYHEFKINEVTPGHQSVTAIEINPVTRELYTLCHSMGYSNPSTYDVMFRSFTRSTNNGNFISNPERTINTTTAGNQVQGQFAINANTGSYMVGWTSETQDGDGRGVYMKVYSSSGSIIKDETRINQVAANNQLAPKIIWEGNTNMFIAFYWYSSVSVANVRYQMLDGNYNFVGTEVVAESRNLINYYTGTYDVTYDRLSKRLLLVYDAYQNTSNTNSNAYFSQLAFNPPAGCISTITSDQNYVEAQSITVKGIANEADCNTLNENSINKVRSYADGLGRLAQTVSIMASPSKKDLIQPVEYDEVGREVKKYLPYAAICSEGGFKDDYASAQALFYNSPFGNNLDRIVNDANPYSVLQYDNSPLERVVKVFGPGNAWQTGTVDHSIRTTERTNTANEVRNWLYNPASLTANGTAFYPAGTLNVSQLIDEDNNISWTYTDFNGRIVLKKHYDSETYYVYDDFGNLRFVISPEGTSRLTDVNFVIDYTGDFTDKWLYTYYYDARQRVVEKKIPGKTVEYMIYDSKVRLVMSQDGVQRSNNSWLFNKYDILDRSILTGIYTHPTGLTRVGMQTLVISSNPSGIDEKREAATTHGYSSNVWPTDPAKCEILQVEYYDDYDFDYNGSDDYLYSVQGLTNEASVNKYVNGLSTGNKIRILGTSNWLKVVNFYDDQNRLIQVQKNNHKNLSSLSEIETRVYDFSGNIIQNYLKHNPGTGTMTVSTRFAYDHQGRLLKTWQKINSEPEVLISQLNYNELGQIIEKNLHSEDNGANYLQSVDYTYNIRGWQTNINGITLTNDGIINNDNNDLFGMTFDYESFYFNGNLSSFGWKSSNINTSQNIFAYSLMYDDLNRLWGAGSFEWTSGGTLISIGKFSEDRISYDKNGNILNLRRRLGSGTIDSLEYKYNGNKLESCKDFKNASLGFKDGSNTQIEYTYDANGNMISDANKGIASITYNHLNLPQIVTFTTAGNRIEYTYSAAGEKLSKKYFTSNVLLVTTDYVSGIVYENNVLKCGQTVEGRFEPNGAGGYKYVYDYKDHLGNVHMSFDKGPDGKARIVQEDHYYPFGMTINSSEFSYRFSTPNDFLYNGKEREEELGFELYDYGARFYDPALGRWGSLEPLSDIFEDYSPYAYCYNNPVLYQDIGGALPWSLVLAGRSLGIANIGSHQGWRTHPITKTPKYHGGMDITTGEGAEVRALAQGKIVKVGWNVKTKNGKTTGYGRYIVIQHKDGYYSLYGHLQKNSAKFEEGQNVKEGDVIGLSGNTGGSTGPHLHLEIIKAESLAGIFKDENKLDPEKIGDLEAKLYGKKSYKPKLSLEYSAPRDNTDVYKQSLQRFPGPDIFDLINIQAPPHIQAGKDVLHGRTRIAGDGRVVQF